ncbi:MAG: hypothetical protein LBT00_15100, partial [Spirochaetaceae bacterium]|nr:hypothetical protein [Spirochaetaceae bacterium]
KGGLEPVRGACSLDCFAASRLAMTTLPVIASEAKQSRREAFSPEGGPEPVRGAMCSREAPGGTGGRYGGGPP